MKYIQSIIFLISMMAFLSCNEEAAVNPPEPTPLYRLTKVAKYVPSDLLSGSSIIVFENEKGDIKEFDLKYKDENLLKFEGEEFEHHTERISMTLNNPYEEYYFFLEATSSRSQIKPELITEYFSVALYTFLTNGNIPVIAINEDGWCSFCELHQSLELNAKVFKDVYKGSAINMGENTPHEFIYYTAEQGIVGFHDFQGKLWTLKEYQ